MSLEERKVILSGIRYIDEIFIYTTEEDVYQKLKELRYDIQFIGADWGGKKFTGHDLGREIHFLKRNHSFSTTELRERIYKAEKEKLENK